MNLMEEFAPGAPAADDFIPLLVPEICGNEWKYVKECLDTNWFSSVGSYVERFEKMVAERAGTQYAVATVNGTAALHIALLLAGVQADDEVLVSSLRVEASCGRVDCKAGTRLKSSPASKERTVVKARILKSG